MRCGYPQITSAFELLRFPLILGVVMIHCDISLYLPAEAAAFDEALRVFTKCVLRICVPLFFVMSGFLFFRSGTLGRKSLLEKWRRRVHTLLVPYLIWNTLGLLCMLLKKAPLLAGYFPQYSDFHISFGTLMSGYVAVGDYPYDFVLWFIRDLMVCVALAPLLWRFLRSTRFAGVCVLFLASLVFKVCGFSLSEWVCDLSVSLFWFSLGAVLPICGVGNRGIDCFLRLMPAAWFLSSLALVVFASGNPWIYRCQDMLVQFTGVFAALYVALYLTGRGYAVSPWLVSSTFFVYAFHGLYTGLVVKSVVAVFPPLSDLAAFADYCIIFLSVVAVSLVFYFILGRYASGVLPFLGTRRPRNGKEVG